MEEAVELVQGLQEQLLAEPYQTLASLRLSQERADEAGPLIDKTLAIIVVRERGPREIGARERAEREGRERGPRGVSCPGERTGGD